MKQVSISEFKAKCLAMLEEVQKTKQAIRVTRFGRPIAEVIPPSPAKSKADLFGLMADTLEIKGDIMSPVIDPDDIEALRD